MSFSNRTAQALLNSLFGKSSNFGALATRPTLHVALFTVLPGEDGSGGTEVSGGSYARVATAPADWGDATLADPSAITNTNPISFPTATDAWGTVVAFGVYDASSGGNFLGGAELGASRAPLSGDTPVFAAGQLTVTLD